MFKFILLTLLLIPTYATAQLIPDVPLRDPYYNVISDAVKKGYFQLNTANQFNPSEPVSRRDLAFILDRLLSSESETELSKVQVQELVNLAKTFKLYTLNTEKRSIDLESSAGRLGQEQTVLHTDISRLSDRVIDLSDRVAFLSSENVRIQAEFNQTTNWLWLGLLASAILGVVF